MMIEVHRVHEPRGRYCTASGREIGTPQIVTFWAAADAMQAMREALKGGEPVVAVVTALQILGGHN